MLKSRRLYAALAAAALALAAFNLTFRLGSEIVTEWDESLYANTASEMVASGDWIGTTFMGSLDYYNTKPPLNVWLIALAFKLFGPSLISLRLTSILAAWLTIAVFQEWVRRSVGPAAALLGSVVLATTFGFLYDHAGRSGNTDALFTLLVLLTVVTLWAARERPWRLAWLGPIAAAVFLLRGMAVLMPLSIVAAVEGWRAVRRQPHRWIPLGTAAGIFMLPVTAWIVARWRLDEWRFLSRMVSYDFLARTFTVIESHPGTPLYYLNVLQRNHYDWLLAGAVAWLLCGISWRRLGRLAAFWRGDNDLTMVIGSWAALTLLIPTLMRTKLAWYLNPFYPPFALGLACLFAHGFTDGASPLVTRRRRTILAITFIVILTTAEARLVWYSFNRRALANSSQGLFLAERGSLGGQRVFGDDHWTHSETFVLKGIIGAEQREVLDLEDFLRNSRVGDFLFSSRDIDHPEVSLVRSNGRQGLYRRRRG